MGEGLEEQYKRLGEKMIPVWHILWGSDANNASAYVIFLDIHKCSSDKLAIIMLDHIESSALTYCGSEICVLCQCTQLLPV